MKDNAEILKQRLAAYARIPGPRVGDYLELQRPDPRCPEFTRFTYDWGEALQTGGLSGSYYFGLGFMSYSGSLDPGIDKTDLIDTGRTRSGEFWFFDGDIRGAGRGVFFRAPFRIFTPRAGANLDGIGELRCFFSLAVKPDAQAPRFCIRSHGYAHCAFNSEPELRAWLDAERLELSAGLDSPYQPLAWGRKEAA